MSAGCFPTPEEERSLEDSAAIAVSETPDPLTALLIDASELAPQMQRQWAARRDGQLTIIKQSLAEWRAADFLIDEEVDVVLYPPGLLAELVLTDRVLPIPAAVWQSDALRHRDFLKHARQSLVQYKGDVWGVPLACPQWMLVYRADLLAQVDVAVPKTWEEFDAAVAKIREADLSIAVSDRIGVPLAEGWAAHLFLARVAAAVRQRGKLSTVFDRSTMEPLITKAPFVDALQTWQQLFGESQERIAKEAGRASAGGTVVAASQPRDLFRRLATGSAVLSITWPQPLEQVPDTPAFDDAVTQQIAVAPLPGADRWYDLLANQWNERPAADVHEVGYMGFGGLIGSVSRDSRNTAAAFDFLEWIAGSSIGGLVLTGSQQSGPFRRSQLKSATKWTGGFLSPAASEAYAATIDGSQRSDLTLVFPGLPGYADYVSTLDAAVRACLAGNKSAAKALASAAKQWEAITDRIGRTEQTANLRHVSGL